MGETSEAHQARWPVASYRYPSHRLTHFRHAQLRGAACHRRQRFLRNKRDNVRCVWCTDAAENANLINNPACEVCEKRRLDRFEDCPL